MEADGIITKIEEEKMSEIKSVFNNIEPIHVDFKDLKSIFAKRKDRLSVIGNLLAISEADSNTTKANKDFIENVATWLGISEGDMSWMKLWIKNIVFQYTLAYDYME